MGEPLIIYCGTRSWRVLQVQCGGPQDLPSLHSQSQEGHLSVSQRQPVWRPWTQVSGGSSQGGREGVRERVSECVSAGLQEPL